MNILSTADEKINMVPGSSPFLRFTHATLINCRVTGIIATLKIMSINLRDKFGLYCTKWFQSVLNILE